MKKDFKLEKLNFFSDYKKVKFKSYKAKNSKYSINDLVDLLEKYKGRPFNDRVEFLEVYTSNKIEGNTLTKGQTKALLEGLCQDADFRTQAEVIQLNRAIRDNLAIDYNLTIDKICQIHKDITFNTLNDGKFEGKIRDTQVYISNSPIIPPKSDSVIRELQKALDIFNSSEKDIIDILKFKLDFVRIHPFMDGNGRLSRLLMNGLLTASNYPRIIIRNQDKGYYYDAIEDSLKVGRYDYWLRFMLMYMKFMCEFEDEFLIDID